mgnify:CR=1 FL=1
MGAVYKAKDTRSGRLVAVKEIYPHPSHDENLKREIKLMQKAHHSGVVDFLSAHIVDNSKLWVRCPLSAIIMTLIKLILKFNALNFPLDRYGADGGRLTDEDPRKLSLCAAQRARNGPN